MAMPPKSVLISVVVMTRNHAEMLDRCLAALRPFAEIFVLDSHSTDATPEIAGEHGVTLIPYQWNGHYPKKKQWALDNLPFTYNWMFYCDVDEVVSEAFIKEMQKRVIDPNMHAYFVTARHSLNGRLLRHGMPNAKLALLRRGFFAYPEVDDLDAPGMSEVEGHYQPVPLQKGVRIGCLRTPLLHHNMDDITSYQQRHDDYARWEAFMTHLNRWPADPIHWRNCAKKFMRQNPLRPLLLFLYSYVVHLGFLDGKEGFHYAKLKAGYARRVLAALNALKNQ